MLLEGMTMSAGDKRTKTSRYLIDEFALAIKTKLPFVLFYNSIKNKK